MNRRTRALDFSQKVKAAIWERDGGRCLICHTPHAAPNAHFIRRSRGGLGIEQNGLTLCTRCHDRYDSGRQDETDELFCWFKAYLKSKYPGWSESKLIYQKYRESGLDIWPEEGEIC